MFPAMVFALAAGWPSSVLSNPAAAPPADVAHTNALPTDWDPKREADRILASLVNITAPAVKGAHDAEMAVVDDKAYVVYEANDVQPGESADWPWVYVILSVVNIKSLAVEMHAQIAKPEQAFENETLPAGACFVPRIIQKDPQTLRCYFASEAPKKRQSQIWFRDFYIRQMTFDDRIHRAKLKTERGTFDMQPQYFHGDAAACGFGRPPVDFGLYIFDSFKTFDGRTFVALNNYPGGQNALAVLNDGLDTFEVLGHYNEPDSFKLTESAVNRLPDGTWMAIVRQEGGDRNYTFCTSKDGRRWTANDSRSFVRNGTSSKPTFDRFGGIYYLGWQDAAMVGGVHRSVFNVDVSRDGKAWQRKYRFETEKSFQYPTFREHSGSIYLTVTQGDASPSRKERIMFGRLE